MRASFRPTVLSARIVRARYGAGGDALQDVALDVQRGEIVGIVGHVGAGKTTLCLAAAGLLEAAGGRIDGRVDHPEGGRPPAALVFSNPWTQLTELGGTVREEVAVGPENQACPTAVIIDRVGRALERAAAASLGERLPSQLSGGELQRVALASALALDSPLLVLDEPTAQLDPDAARDFVAAVRALAAEGRTILIAEQNLELVRDLATRLLVLADGRVLAEGTPGELLNGWPPLDPRLGAPASVERNHVPARRAALPDGGRPILDVEGLSAGYPGRDVLRSVSLTLPRGRAIAWLGHNGAGKSTLARAILGLVATTAGSIRVDGALLDHLKVEERARHVGLVFQDPSRQLFCRSVLDEALFAPRALGVAEAESKEGAREALEAVGLMRAGSCHPGDLSPQAQRRLAIAAAMSARPPLLILDEPTAGQDAEGRAHIARALEMQRNRGAAAVITHDLRFARATCDGVVTLEGGRLVSTNR
ncbi:MAG: ATP-binding cassette domain-containing protein [Gemmatimonadota bacterium]|nr:ATP-binding cassette domain-containing protein [Gemmatimonadota bacterium]